jgi:hypothetical protein
LRAGARKGGERLDKEEERRRRVFPFHSRAQPDSFFRVWCNLKMTAGGGGARTEKNGERRRAEREQEAGAEQEKGVDEVRRNIVGDDTVSFFFLSRFISFRSQFF